jgi:hypothetical protein
MHDVRHHLRARPHRQPSAIASYSALMAFRTTEFWKAPLTDHPTDSNSSRSELGSRRTRRRMDDRAGPGVGYPDRRIEGTHRATRQNARLRPSNAHQNWRGLCAPSPEARPCPRPQHRGLQRRLPYVETARSRSSSANVGFESNAISSTREDLNPDLLGVRLVGLLSDQCPRGMRRVGKSSHHLHHFRSCLHRSEALFACVVGHLQLVWLMGHWGQWYETKWNLPPRSCFMNMKSPR